MTTHQYVFAAEALPAGQRTSLSHWIRSAGQRVAAWVETCAAYWAAGAMYEQLSALSDAELARRGLSRVTLAEDVRAVCDRNGTRGFAG